MSEIQPVANARAATLHRSGWKLQDRCCPEVNACDQEGPHTLVHVEDLPVVIQDHHIDCEKHSQRVNALRWDDQQSIPGRKAAFSEKPDNPAKPRLGDADGITQDGPAREVPRGGAVPEKLHCSTYLAPPCSHALAAHNDDGESDHKQNGAADANDCC